jgi:hypothetical protein
MTAMLFGKDRGPIYSHYDMDRPGNVDPVVDYAGHGWSTEDMAFIMSHKISPTQADPGDMNPGSGRTYAEQTASLRSFLQLESPSGTQASLGEAEVSPNQGQQPTSWSYQRRNTKRTQAGSKAALVGIIIWFLFILISMLMSFRGK